MRFLAYFLVLFILGACTDTTVHVKRGIYFWENNTRELTAENRDALDALEIQKLYVKVFEVDRVNSINQAIAKTQLKLDQEVVKRVEVIPCVYMLNSVFIESSKKELDELAVNVAHLIDKYTSEKLLRGTKINYSEIQIDCDWSEKSQGNYFYFLRKMKTASKKKISCTLRLYPYKFHKVMGVPPCDRATLMCYNLLNPLKNPRKNTILDTDEMAKYLDTKIDYPVALDVALPVYSWMQCYDGRRFKGVVYGPVEAFSPLLKHDKGLWNTMLRDTVVSDIYLRKGDRIKIERVSKQDLAKAVEIIHSSNALSNQSVFSYFHLNSAELKFYNYETLNAHFTRLSR